MAQINASYAVAMAYALPGGFLTLPLITLMALAAQINASYAVAMAYALPGGFLTLPLITLMALA
ncbi:hypothetical protein KMB89_gp30 [Citrobacter phage HCF1]|uniref:Uncharacterized protein n=1 Tax=Citrobacter phage HCF1 TaxID=2849700 RepID=A0ABX6D8W6_9CAUD|nr:hypothetical protein KMB89_gp30 [Citrobacter phage HCF1]